VVADLGVPLRPHVLEGGGVHQGKTYQEDVCLWIRQRPQPVVIFLSGCVPQPQVDGFAVHHHVGRVVVEHCGDVFTGEGVGCVTDQQTSFAYGTVAYDDTLDGLHLAVDAGVSGLLAELAGS